MNITIINPDDPFGPPAYDGPANEAHTKLATGGYDTTDPDVAVLVVAGSSLAVAVVDIDRVHTR